MTICAGALAQLNAFLSQAMHCADSEAGYEVIRTPFLYPDRDNIDLFVKEVSGGKLLISDLGQTALKLASYGFEAGTSARRRAMIYQITASANVRYENGSVVISVEKDEIGSRLWDVLVAIQRISDLVFTVQAYTKATFTDEFENFVVELKVAYSRGVQLQLPTGYVFSGDFIIRDTKVVQLLSASSHGYARERVDRVHTNFAELEFAKDDRERIAVIDDRQEVWTQTILLPIMHRATKLLRWTRRGELEQALVA